MELVTMKKKKKKKKKKPWASPPSNSQLFQESVRSIQGIIDEATFYNEFLESVALADNLYKENLNKLGKEAADNLVSGFLEHELRERWEDRMDQESSQSQIGKITDEYLRLWDMAGSVYSFVSELDRRTSGFENLLGLRRFLAWLITNIQTRIPVNSHDTDAPKPVALYEANPRETMPIMHRIQDYCHRHFKRPSEIALRTANEGVFAVVLIGRNKGDFRERRY